MDDKTSAPDWELLLERFTQTLAGVQESLAKAAAREANSIPPARAAAHAALLAEQTPRIHGLANKATAITQWVDTMESELCVSEDLLRVLLTQTEMVRRKLATWAGRAIG